MLFGRPVDGWTGLIGGAVGLAILIIGVTQPDDVAKQWSVILGGVGTFLGVLVAFLANQPPTLAPGDAYSIQTPKGQPNYTATVAAPPAATTPVVDPAPGG